MNLQKIKQEALKQEIFLKLKNYYASVEGEIGVTLNSESVCAEISSSCRHVKKRVYTFKGSVIGQEAIEKLFKIGV